MFLPNSVWKLKTAAFIGGLLTSVALFPLGATFSNAQNGATERSAQTKTSGEMLPTQGWFWNLFSGGSRREERPRKRDDWPGGSRHQQDEEPEGDERRQGRANTSGTYRTLCVRLCDGFHWPISYRTTRDRFAHDAKQCEQACPTRSRLFVHRNPGEDPATMVDLQGRPYRQLENAFRHQTEHISGCTCHGNPWEEEALARHRAYAEAAKAGKDPAVVATAEKPSAEKETSRRERRTGSSERWARSGWRNRERNDD
jgi:hypothetical protein